MHIIYIDDSGDNKVAVFSALAIPVREWHASFAAVRDFRRNLKKLYGIYVYKELHAWKFVSGRGRPSGSVVTKSQRVRIFNEALQLVSQLPGARLFNSASARSQEVQAFEWMLNRINRTLVAWDSHAILISDQGKEITYTRMVRRMYVYNPIPSQFGMWDETGKSWKNIPLERIVEDPFFKDSAQSYFIQLVDFCAYALLRRENPIPSKTKFGLDKSFNVLGPILVTEATGKDPEGIIRPY